MPAILKDFKWSLIIASVALAFAYYWAGVNGFIAAAILIVLEVSISFDNAIVNSKVLATMSPLWQKRFLTWGMLIAVLGMRAVFPLAIVAIASGLGLMEVANMALNSPDQYEHHLHEAHYIISAFGGTFLLLVFSEFMLDYEKEMHWIKAIERRLSNLAKLESMSVVITIIVLMTVSYYVPAEKQSEVLLSGLVGMLTFILLGSFSSYMEEHFNHTSESLKKSFISAGAMSFIYLEVLDASFSLDGVIGAFAVTKDVVIIMLGLGVGALFVRSMTVSLVKHGTLGKYVFLDHGAHYAIGSLAMIMFLSMFVEVNEVVTGLIGATFIGLGLWASIRYNLQENRPT
jgi:hypothetical protein